MSKARCDLSVIVVSWNTKELLSDCLRSIYAHTSSIKFEVIVVDNASTDGSPEMVENDFPQLILIKNKENIGFGRANNQAMKIARGKYVGLLNSDAALINNTFEILLKYLETMPSVGLIGPMLLCEDGKIDKSCARKFITLWTEFLAATKLGVMFSSWLNNKYLFAYDYSINQMVDCISGACLVINREAIVDNQIFDPAFFMYGEDIDLCNGAKERGWDIFYCSEGRVLHRGKASSVQNSEISLHAYNSLNLFIFKAYGRNARALHRCIWLSSFIIKYLITLLMLQITPKSRQTTNWIRRRDHYNKLIRFAVGGNQK